MKVVLFSAGFFEYVIELANALSVRHEVVLMLPQNHLLKNHYLSISENVTCDLFYMPRQRNPACQFMIRDIVKKIHTHNPELLHIQAHGHTWFFAAFPFLKKYPIINTVHDPKPHLGEEQIWRKILINFGIKNSDSFIVHGDKLKSQMMQYYNISSDRINVIPHGHYEVYRDYSREVIEEEGSILFFGRLWKYKGLEYLIKAEPIISKEISNFKIVLAFHGESFDRYKKFIKNIDRFEIHGRYIPNDEFPDFFGKASVVVLPYIEASQSGIVAVSFAFGKPVVVTDVGALPEVVENGKRGFVVPPKDEVALAQAIVKILKNKKLKEKMGKNAYDFSVNDLSWEKIASKTSDLYRKQVSKI